MATTGSGNVEIYQYKINTTTHKHYSDESAIQYIILNSTFITPIFKHVVAG